MDVTRVSTSDTETSYVLSCAFQPVPYVDTSRVATWRFSVLKDLELPDETHMEDYECDDVEVSDILPFESNDPVCAFWKHWLPPTQPHPTPMSTLPLNKPGDCSSSGGDGGVEATPKTASIEQHASKLSPRHATACILLTPTCIAPDRNSCRVDGNAGIRSGGDGDANNAGGEEEAYTVGVLVEGFTDGSLRMSLLPDDADPLWMNAGTTADAAKPRDAKSTKAGLVGDTPVARDASDDVPAASKLHLDALVSGGIGAGGSGLVEKTPAARGASDDVPAASKLHLDALVSGGMGAGGGSPVKSYTPPLTNEDGTPGFVNYRSSLETLDELYVTDNARSGNTDVSSAVSTDDESDGDYIEVCFFDPFLTSAQSLHQ
jgi:hypothetical protein